MPVLRRPYERARRLARELLWEYGMDEVWKIDPFVILARNEIELTYAPLDGASGHIFRNGDRAVIRVSDQIVQLGRRRFTIAHEAGHFLLRHKISTSAILDANAPPPFSAHQEREANVFATEFLMPEAWVKPYCKGTSISLSVVRAIAEAFRVSNVAAAVRHVELSDAPCAAAYSEDGRVVWATSSKTFPARIPPQLKIGAGAIASDCYERAILESTARVVPAHAWFGTQTPSTVGAVTEHAEPVPEVGWGGMLSLISLPASA